MKELYLFKLIDGAWVQDDTEDGEFIHEWR